MFDIEKMTPCLFRDTYNGKWVAGLFKELDSNSRFTFQSMEDEIYTQIAPLAGNEKCIGTTSEPFNRWDAERLEIDG